MRQSPDLNLTAKDSDLCNLRNLRISSLSLREL
jgi:hypothetical protein